VVPTTKVNVALPFSKITSGEGRGGKGAVSPPVPGLTALFGERLLADAE
jgi:hypothetical protein